MFIVRLLNVLIGFLQNVCLDVIALSIPWWADVPIPAQTSIHWQVALGSDIRMKRFRDIGHCGHDAC